MSPGDRAIGIAIGVLLGLAIVIAFVFLDSGDTIDDPSLSGEGTQTQQAPRPSQGAP